MTMEAILKTYVVDYKPPTSDQPTTSKENKPTSDQPTTSKENATDKPATKDDSKSAEKKETTESEEKQSDVEVSHEKPAVVEKIEEGTEDEEVDIEGDEEENVEVRDDGGDGEGDLVDVGEEEEGQDVYDKEDGHPMGDDELGEGELGEGELEEDVLGDDDLGDDVGDDNEPMEDDIILSDLSAPPTDNDEGVNEDANPDEGEEMKPVEGEDAPIKTNGEQITAEATVDDIKVTADENAPQSVKAEAGVSGGDVKMGVTATPGTAKRGRGGKRVAAGRGRGKAKN